MRKIIAIISASLLWACLKKENAGISDPNFPPKESIQYKTVMSTSDENCIPFQMPNFIEKRLDVTSGKNFKCYGWGGGDSCAGNSEYQGFDVTDSLFYLWINFKPEIVQNYSDRSLRENFKWFWFQFYWNGGNSVEDEFLTPRTFVESLDSLEKFEYREGKLSIEKSGQIKKVIRWVEPKGPACFDTDVGPRFCACEYDVDIKYKVSISLPLQQK